MFLGQSFLTSNKFEYSKFLVEPNFSLETLVEPKEISSLGLTYTKLNPIQSRLIKWINFYLIVLKVIKLNFYF